VWRGRGGLESRGACIEARGRVEEGGPCGHVARACWDELGAERALAERLSTVWSDCWRDLSGWETAGPPERSRGLEQGLEILSYTLRLRLAADEVHVGELRRYGYALRVLQSIGEGYALLSEPWPIGSQPTPAMPDGSICSASMEAHGVFEWAASLGYPLTPWQGASFESGAIAAPTTEEQMAEVVGLGLRDYGMFLEHLSHPEGRVTLSTHQAAWRRSVCAGLSALRLMYDRQLSPGATQTIAGLALALLLTLTDAQFVALAAPPDQLDIAPLLGVDVVSASLKDTGVRDWLNHHGQGPASKT